MEHEPAQERARSRVQALAVVEQEHRPARALGDGPDPGRRHVRERAEVALGDLRLALERRAQRGAGGLGAGIQIRQAGTGRDAPEERARGGTGALTPRARVPDHP